MTVSITVYGETAEEARSEMKRLLGDTKPIFAPAVSDVSSDNGPADLSTEAETVATSKPPRATRKTNKPAPTLEATATSVTIEAAADPTPAISTGGERVDTEVKPAPPADAAPLTLDDVRKAAEPYVKKYTIVAAQTDLQDILETATAGAGKLGVRSIGKLDPTDQDALKKAIAAFEKAIDTPGAVALRLAGEAAATVAA